ncbi:MAG: YciI family protein [Pseudomonadota bacterium]
MFVVVLTYTSPLAEVDAHLAGHRAWLQTQYQAGVFIASGRQVPPAGGVILARGSDRAALEAILALDPFGQNGLADYQVIQFTPNLSHPDFVALKEA